jgi:hypothetical protein
VFALDLEGRFRYPLRPADGGNLQALIDRTRAPLDLDWIKTISGDNIARIGTHEERTPRDGES